jgi:hypothetical protein
MTLALILGLYLTPSAVILVLASFKYRRELRRERKGLE